jgi:hypothetical protein
MHAIKIEDTVPAPYPTCASAPESARSHFLRPDIAEYTVPDPGTLGDFRTLRHHRALYGNGDFKPWPRELPLVPDEDFVSTTKVRTVIDGALQRPLSWDGTYAKFLGVPISWPEMYNQFRPAHQFLYYGATPLAWAIRVVFVIALFVFVSALVGYFNIGYYIGRVLSYAWAANFPPVIDVPVAQLVSAR